MQEKKIKEFKLMTRIHFCKVHIYANHSCLFISIQLCFARKLIDCDLINGKQ